MMMPDDDRIDLDPLLRQAVTDLRAPVPARAAARDALRTALAHELRAHATPVSSGSRDVRRLRWFTTSRPVRVSPLGLLAAASLLIAATATITARLGTRGTAATGTLAGATSAATATQVVRFSVAAPAAHAVALVGDFNGWDPTATALRQQDGTWSVVIPVTPGRHQYGFVIDGSTWIADPQAARSADADFGSANSVVYVGS